MRWGILKGAIPCNITIVKTVALVSCLARLHITSVMPRRTRCTYARVRGLSGWTTRGPITGLRRCDVNCRGGGGRRDDGDDEGCQGKDGPCHVPLGVLKAGTIDFVPPLPGEKLTAIEAMGYGTVNKCILSWYDGSALVWPEEDTWFMLITLEEETSGTWTTFFNLSLLTGRPTLVLFAAGDDAAAMEDQSDEEVLGRDGKPPRHVPGRA